MGFDVHLWVDGGKLTFSFCNSRVLKRIGMYFFLVHCLLIIFVISIQTSQPWGPSYLNIEFDILNHQFFLIDERSFEDVCKLAKIDPIVFLNNTQKRGSQWMGMQRRDADAGYHLLSPKMSLDALRNVFYIMTIDTVNANN